MYSYLFIYICIFTHIYLYICIYICTWTWVRVRVARQAGEEDGMKTYFIHGPFFFTSANRFLKILNPDNDPDQVWGRWRVWMVQDMYVTL